MHFVSGSQVAVRLQRWERYYVCLDFHRRMDYILLKCWIAERIVPLVEQMDPENVAKSKGKSIEIWF